MEPVKLRPHHLLDIVRDFEPGRTIEPAESGNAVHEIHRIVGTDLDTMLTFVIDVDDICRPCRHLQEDGTCERILERLNPPQRMQEYNDRLDSTLFSFLGLEPGASMSIRSFLEDIASRMPDIESVGTLQEETKNRFRGLAKGLQNLGIV